MNNKGGRTGKMLLWLLKWTVCVIGLLATSTASPDDASVDFGGESGSGMLQTDDVNVLQELSLRISNSSNASMTVGESRCPVLQVGQYSTLALPLRQIFTDGFEDEFSLLLQLRSPQREERSVFTMLSPDSHVMLQLRISAHAVIFIGTQQRHYEFPVSGLSDGKWHHVAISVAAKRLALYVDCSLLESVDWVYYGMGISTDGLLMVGGIIESFETPFEGHLRQLAFLTGDPDAARQHCSHHPPRCSNTTPSKPPRSPRTNSLQNILLSSNDLEDLMGDPKEESSLSFGRTGSVLINTNEARIVERYLTFKEGVAYGIDHLLEPPGLGAFCDTIENRTTSGRCGSCLFTPPCLLKHHDMGKKEHCLNLHRFGRYPRWYDNLDHHFSRSGCKRVCSFQSWVQKCCKNHYGRDCQVCPGGLESPCSNHGDCNDGVLGRGTCRCRTGFRGEACELCAAGFYGSNCTACDCRNQGRCDDGIEGSGQCTCKPGWEGNRCQNKQGSIPEVCRQCHAQADCVERVGCQCKPGFQGNGTFCTPEPPPDLCAEYNGGCHLNADCNQTGRVVNCTCHSGYQGDGYSCEPINRCVAEGNGGCSDFASCKFTGPNERECECLPGYVGNGVQCLEKVVPPVDRCLEGNGGCDPVASCKDLHYHTNTAGVFHLRSTEGKYKMNFSQADAACQAEGATLATFKQLGDAQQLGMHLCVAGWMEGAKVGYPTRYPSVRCGDNHVGLVMYKEPVDQSIMYDAYCYRLTDVSCVCPADYVGNGDFCNGVLSSVLATYSNFSIFHMMLLEYSSSSPEGKQLVEFLSLREAEVTLFVPHNAGFGPNQTLSGRDLEYHISANHSRRPFKELKHQTAIASRLGFNLTVTHGNNESSKLVNERLLLEWDIPAVNGIIHIIEAPLTAPPPPRSHSSQSHAHSSSTVSAILVTLLLVCVLAALGYYVFKHKTDAFRFHYFRNDDEGATGGTPKPTLVSIPNPLYFSSRALSEPFEDTNQEVAPEEPEEPLDILDLGQ